MSIDGFGKDEKEISKKISEARQDTKSWPLTDEQLRQIESVLNVEGGLIRRLGEAHLAAYEIRLQTDKMSDSLSKVKGEREALCRKFETDLGIPKGTTWIINFDTHTIDKKN